MKLTKVKGHATTEMVEEGKVPFPETYGNDQADMSAEKGTELGQSLVKRYTTFAKSDIANTSSSWEGYRISLSKSNGRTPNSEENKS